MGIGAASEPPPPQRSVLAPRQANLIQPGSDDDRPSPQRQREGGLGGGGGGGGGGGEGAALVEGPMSLLALLERNAAP
eukprot:COSAG01_NODE_1241_length_11085_cov_9.712361_25_plen_78_part_00